MTDYSQMSDAELFALASQSPEASGLSLPDKLSGGIASGMQGLMGGFLDEAGAALTAVPVALGRTLSGKPMSIPEAYNEELAANRASLAGVKEQMPVASTVSEVAGAIASPINKIKLGTGALGAVRTGIAQGGIFGLGAGEGEDTAKSVLTGMGTGGAVSGLFAGAGKAVEKAAPALGKFGVSTKLKALGINYSDIKKSLDKSVKGLGEEAPIKQAALELAEQGHLVAGEGAENLQRIMGQIDESGQAVKQIFQQVDTVQPDVINLDFKNTAKYVNKLDSHAAKKGTALLAEIKDSIDKSGKIMLSDLQAEQQALSKAGATSYGASGSDALEANIKKYMALDIKQAIDSELQKPIYAGAGDAVKAYRAEMAKRFQVLPALVKASAREGADDVVQKLAQITKTTGSFGVPILMGAGLAGPAGALAGMGASAYLNSTTGKNQVANALMKAGKADGSSLIAAGQAAARALNIGTPEAKTEPTFDYSKMSDDELLSLIGQEPKKKVESVKTSPQGIELIKQHEALRTSRYNDATGTPTIGYGHTGKGVQKGKISEAEAEELLKQDLADAENAVLKNVKAELTQNQFDALTSLVFNIGAGAFQRSTLLKKLNAGDIEGAAAEFKRWNKSKGKTLAGLAKRRGKEAELFLA